MKSVLTTSGLLLALALLPHSGHAQAVYSYTDCDGTYRLTSLPATITAPGTYCIAPNNLTTLATSGAAITITTDNVTIDCNNNPIRGTKDPNATTSGIEAYNRRNIIIRRCNVQGFFRGIRLYGTGGGRHLVEDNLLDQNLAAGIVVDGDENTVRRNRIYRLGGSNSDSGYGIYAAGDVIDNTIHAIGSITWNAYAGITVFGPRAEVSGNRIHAPVGLAGSSTVATGVYSLTNAVIRNNHIDVFGGSGSRALGGTPNVGPSQYCIGNIVTGVDPTLHNCVFKSGNNF